MFVLSLVLASYAMFDLYRKSQAELRSVFESRNVYLVTVSP